MRQTCLARVTVALLAAALASFCHAQPQPPVSENQARYYVYGAFLTHAVPEIMGERVALGPELEQRLGVSSGSDRKRIYDALMSYTDGKRLSVRKSTADELARYPAKRALRAPVFTVQAGEILLLVEYDMQANIIPFVGQLGAPPIVEQRAAPAAPAVAVVAPKPAPAVKPAPPPPPPVPAEALKPSGPCLVKPVMSEQDLANCRAAPAATTTRVAPPTPSPSPPAPVKPQARVAPPPPAEPALRPTGPCEVKPVMTEQDLVNCRAASTVAPRVDPGPPPRPQARGEAQKPDRKPAMPCVIKPVMSEEDLIACGIRR